MNRVDFNLKLIGFSVGTFFSWVVGGLGVAFLVLLGLMALDFVTGVMVAWKRQETASSVAYEKLPKKIYIILLVMAVWLIQTVAAAYAPEVQGLEWFTYTVDGICIAYIVIEFVSLLENGVALNVSMPGFLKHGLKVYHEMKKKEEGDLEEKDA